MTGYIQVNLQNLIDEKGEDFAKQIISGYSCPLNDDVSYFLKNKAIEFSKQSLSRTFLVFASYKREPVLVGYYTLANKFIHIDKNSLSSKLRKKISKFAQYDCQLHKYTLSAPLIAQLGKNYANGYNEQITGDELLKLACDKVREIQCAIGGKIVYLECEDNEKLTEFYAENGFVNFGKRKLDHEETEKMDGRYLIQMLRYL
ncbi:MAG: N-acetyltransferase [Clostridia bacterium]